VCEEKRGREKWAGGAVWRKKEGEMERWGSGRACRIGRGREGRAAWERGRGEDDGRGEREIVWWNWKKRRRNVGEGVELCVE
jgi:hypothetical protein